MGLHHDQVVIIVIALALALLTVTVMTQVQNITDASTDTACRSAVLTKKVLVELNGGGAQDASLPGCSTRQRAFTEEDHPSEIAFSLAKDALWCHRSFAGAWEESAPLVSGTKTLCHVCAIYSHETTTQIPDILATLYAEGGGTYEESREAPPGERLGLLVDHLGSNWNLDRSLPERDTITLSHDKPLAVMFVQESNQDLTLLGKLLFSPETATETAQRAAIGINAIYLTVTRGRGIKNVKGFLVRTAASEAVGYGLYYGGYIGESEIISSGMVIKPFDEKLVNDLGCTLTDISDSR